MSFFVFHHIRLIDNISIDSLLSSLDPLNNIKKIKEMKVSDLFDKIGSAQKAINGITNFETYVENYQVIKENLPYKTCTTLSVICNYSCHQIFLLSNDEEKRLYPVIREEISTECKGKCH